MKILVSKLKVVVPILILFGWLAGCTSHPDEEQIKALEETKAAALSAEQTLASKKQEASTLESQCEAKKAELEKVKKEKEVVLQRLEEKKKAGM
jgi:septal ring factor EnvC (AmiA/AmiB activator)